MASSTNVETAQAAMDALRERAERAERLLLGACRIIADQAREAGDEPTEYMGPDLASFWRSQPESLVERARRVLLSIPDKDIITLNAYLADHDILPMTGETLVEDEA